MTENNLIELMAAIRRIKSEFKLLHLVFFCAFSALFSCGAHVLLFKR